MFKISKLYAPFVALFLCYLLTILVEMSPLPSPDLQLARWLNSWIGRSPTYDLTLIFLLLNTGDILGFAVMGALIYRLSRQAKGGEMNAGHRLAFALLIAGNLWFAYELVDYLQVRIELASPASLLDPFNSIRTYSGRVHLFEEHTFPSLRTTLFCLTNFLAGLRFGWEAIKIFPATLLFCLPRLLVGAEGLASLIGGAFLAWFLAATNNLLWPLYLASERRMGVWHYRLIGRRLSEFLATLINMNTRRKALKPFQTSQNETLPDIVMDENLQDFVKREWGVGQIQIKHKPHKHKLFQLFTDQGTIAFKISRCRTSERRSLRRVLEFAQQIEANSMFRMPRILPALDGEWLKSYGNHLVYAMEWLEGRPVDMTRQDEVQLLMRTLAHWHAQGERALANQTATAETLIAAAAEKLHLRTRQALDSSNRLSLRQRLTGTSKDLGFLLEELVRAETLTRFAHIYAHEDSSEPRLCFPHGDTHPLNFLMQPDGSLAILDFDRIKPGLGYTDLASPLLKLMHRYQWDFSVFEQALEEYLKIRPLPRFELVLMMADILYPHRATKIFDREDTSKHKLGIRMVRERFLSSVVFESKRKFIQMAGERYRIPLIALTFSGQVPESLLEEVAMGLKHSG